MRSSARVGHRSDSEELIPAARIGRRGTVTLEMLITGPLASAISDMMIAAVRVALPNLDPGSGNGASDWVENAPGDPRGRALSRPLVPGDMDQVVIGILRETKRVERAGCLPW